MTLSRARCAQRSSSNRASPEMQDRIGSRAARRAAGCPEIPGDVVLADEVHVVERRGRRLGGADDVIEEDLSREPVPDVLVPDEPRRVHRDDRDRHLPGDVPADGLDVVARHRRDARRVDEHRLRLRVPRREVDDRAAELLLAAEDDVVLEHLRREPAPVQLRAARACAAVVPGVPGARDGAVHEVDRVGHGHEHDAGTVERAAPLGPLAGLRLLAELRSALLLGVALGRVVVVGPRHGRLARFVGIGGEPAATASSRSGGRRSCRP